jgi:hypothetical protein
MKEMNGPPGLILFSVAARRKIFGIKEIAAATVNKM